MNLPYSEDLPIGKLSRIFDNTSECYKFFWYQAILNQVMDEQYTMRFEDLIDEMISNAWYMVTEYHLNLGPSDTLEKCVILMQERSSLQTNEKKQRILRWLRESDDPDIKKHKKTLINMVPYRLLAPFTELHEKSGGWKSRKSDLIARLNEYSEALYYFGEYRGLDTELTIRPEWAEYFRQNEQIIEGWLEYKLIEYLQKRNPSVPGIIDKLRPPEERKLEAVKKFYRAVIGLHPIRDIYTGEKLAEESDLSIDHFIPWSYVAHDELWNLNPTERSVNSSKGNNLPKWDRYFKLLGQQEYEMNQLIWINDTVHRSFESCAQKNLNDIRIRESLYRRDISESEFKQKLEEIIRPEYNAAKRCGFREWDNDRQIIEQND